MKIAREAKRRSVGFIVEWSFFGTNRTKEREIEALRATENERPKIESALQGKNVSRPLNNRTPLNGFSTIFFSQNLIIS